MVMDLVVLSGEAAGEGRGCSAGGRAVRVGISALFLTCVCSSVPFCMLDVWKHPY